MPKKRDIHYETLDEGIIRLRDYKQKAADLVFFHGEPLDKFLRRVYEAEKLEHVKGVAGPKLESVGQEICKTAAKLYGQGTDNLKAVIGSEGFRRFGDLMSENFQYLANGHTARYISDVVNSLEKKGRKIERIVDLGCGPGTLSRTMEKPVTCVDFSDYMLELAKKASKKLGIRNKYVKRLIQDTRLPSGSFDMAVASYVFHYQAQGSKRVEVRKKGKHIKVLKEYREIDDAIKESNRILRRGGIFVISLPPGIKDPSLKELTADLGYYGFDTKFADLCRPTRAQDVGGREVDPRFRGSYIVVARKARKAPEEYPPLKKIIHNTRDFVFALGGDRRRKGKVTRLSPKEKVIEFDPIPTKIASRILS